MCEYVVRSPRVPCLPVCHVVRHVLQLQKRNDDKSLFLLGLWWLLSFILPLLLSYSRPALLQCVSG